ncbi:DNA topoisomerase I [Halococcoides cellulosivorans]|uniref:DNA topoisomerase 1 n=1 Tax=Halococcoides cellulosivorans TaxID=1679096 RepID=A0A2R4X271_9EURY|nr:DNA topoisomerase I [Halococcoides cellulosivorans]AWB27884.1 DNA topoisomerase I [Halococcoides cellulosivorans]
MRLIVTEKDNAAERLAAILSDGRASVERRGDVPVRTWGDSSVIGLSGHVVEVDFPPEYGEWRDVEPVELIDTDVMTRPTREDIVGTLQTLASDADDIVIATDYDREGELIGKEAHDLVRDVTDAPIERVRFSSITEGEVREAFETPDSLDFDLAAAGEARQIIDLVWGAALTRFLSLAAGQLGEDFISVGRVQSPTLKLLVDREREIEAFDPDDYWEICTDLDVEGTALEAQYFYDDEGSEAERIWDADRAAQVVEALRTADSAAITTVRRRTRTDRPPAPFDTTAFISAAGSLGYSAQRAMSIAEELYTEGYLSYPRTDNTVYPDDLDARERIADFEGTAFDESVERLLAREEIDPTRGDTESTDHPPIHPTGELPDRGDIGEDAWELYELVVRRFFATCAGPAEWEHLRIVATATGDEDHQLKATGKRLLEEGYHAVYPYSGASEHHLPDLDEGQRVAIEGVDLQTKQTQPPRRFGQSRLIERMADQNLGTKATRHNIIEKLYDRGYVENDPPVPTALARAVVSAAEDHAEPIVTAAMTAELERDMTAIADGESSLDAVTDESREMLHEVFDALHESREAIADELRSSLKDDRRLGPCPECGESLLIRRSRQGSYFVGCDGYPDCEFTLPLPDAGEPVTIEESCTDHDLAHVKLLDGRDTRVHGCPLCHAETAAESEDRVIGPCPECGETHGGELAIKRLRSGSRLVGCTRYPDCEYSVPVPRRGEIAIDDEDRCEIHDLPAIAIVSDDDDDPWELGCPICNFEAYQAEQAPDELEDLNGVGPATADKLASEGVESPDDLVELDAEGLAEAVSGVSADQVREWQAELGV